MSTPLHTLLRERRTVHEYSPREIPLEALERGVEAAMAAPNHRMTEPWRFLRVGPSTREALIQRALELKGRAGAFPQEAAERLRKKFTNPAELLVVCQVLAERPDVREEDYASVACAIHNLSLSLWAEGFGSKWSTGAVTRDAATYRILGLNSEHQRIVGFLWAGVPASEPKPKPRRKRPLSEVLQECP